MRPVLTKIIDRVSAAVDASAYLPSQSLFQISLQAVVTGTSTGTLKLQYSNDIVNPTEPSGTTPTNWTDISGASVAVAGAGVVGIPKTDLCYEFVKVVFTHTSGEAGTLTVNVKAFGS